MDTTRKAVSTAEKRPACPRMYMPVSARLTNDTTAFTHENEEGVDVVRVIGDSVFIMTEDRVLHEVPSLETVLDKGE